jgi:hypothetical protein
MTEKLSKTRPNVSDKSAKSLSPAEVLLAELSARGIELQARGDRLRFGPREAATPDLVQQLKIHKAELLALLSQPPAAPPPWDEAEARQLLSELHAEVDQLRQLHFGGTFPEPLATVVADYLAVAEAYVTDHEGEASRGWDALELLRGVLPRLRQIIERVKAEQKTTR